MPPAALCAVHLPGNGLIGSIVVPIFANPDIAGIGGRTQAGLLYGGGGAAEVDEVSGAPVLAATPA